MITSDRNIFIGAHVTEIVRQQMEEAAKKSGVSMSVYTFEALKEKLKKEGYNPDIPVVDRNSVPLPFEVTDGASDEIIQRNRSKSTEHPNK